MLTKASVSCLLLVVIFALLPLTAAAKNVKAIHGVFMHAEGFVPLPKEPGQPMPIIAPAPLNMPGFLMYLVGSDALVIKTVTHVENAICTTSVILVQGEGYSTGAMQAVPSEPVNPSDPQSPTWRMVMLDANGDLIPTGFPISVFTVALDSVTLGDGMDLLEGLPVPAHTIAFSGTVVENPVPSPFGLLTGRAASFSAQFDTLGDTVNFKFVGGFVAGSHSTWSMQATGVLRISGYYLQ